MDLMMILGFLAVMVVVVLFIAGFNSDSNSEKESIIEMLQRKLKNAPHVGIHEELEKAKNTVVQGESPVVKSFTEELEEAKTLEAQRQIISEDEEKRKRKDEDAQNKKALEESRRRTERQAELIRSQISRRERQKSNSDVVQDTSYAHVSAQNIESSYTPSSCDSSSGSSSSGSSSSGSSSSGSSSSSSSDSSSSSSSSCD